MNQPKRQIRIEGDIAYIPLTRGYEAIIDSSDVDLVKDQTWYAFDGVNTVYAATNSPVRNGTSTIIFLHRIILNAPKGIEVDHKFGKGLDNRRSQIRLATKTQNRRNKARASNNTSGFKGVSWSVRFNNWRAYIKINGKMKHLGVFQNPEDAHAAYCKAATELHGEFARTA